MGRKAGLAAALFLIAAFTVFGGARGESGSSGTQAPAPQAAPQSSAPQNAAAGSSLFGPLEGGVVVTDGTYPRALKEAPMLAEMVRAGQLPALGERIPAGPELMVIKPLRAVGKFGGTLRTVFTGPGDYENPNRLNNMDRPLMWDYTDGKVTPGLGKSWKISEDGKVFTLYLRKGLRWSDGAPFTADDFIFWYEDIYLNKELVSAPFPQFQVNNQNGVYRKVDDYTVEFVFPEPYMFFLNIISGTDNIGGGFTSRGAFQGWGGGYAPKHYLQQFLPKYSSEAEVNAKARAEGYDNWISLLRFKYSWLLNPDVPVMTAWRTDPQHPINTSNLVLVRNPYFWVVDTEGNQLPYVDRISFTLAENNEVANLRAIAGEYDFQQRFLDLGKLPVFIENAEKGNYTVHLDRYKAGSNITLYTGTGYTKDPEIAKWLHTKAFRQALSAGIDRDQINEALYMGLGVPGNMAPKPPSHFSPGPEFSEAWVKYEPDKANQMLDDLGLRAKDSEGFRQRSDGKGRLIFEITVATGSTGSYLQTAQMVANQWRRIGIFADVKETEKNLAFTRDLTDENQFMVWSGGGEEIIGGGMLTLPVESFESHLGGGVARWYVSNGREGVKPFEDDLAKALDLYKRGWTASQEEMVTMTRDIWKILADNCFGLGTVGGVPEVHITKKNLENVPRQYSTAGKARRPHGAFPETWFFTD